MGHRHIQFTGHTIDSETDQGRTLQHPDQCIFYPSGPHFPLPNIHSGNPINFHPIIEHHDSTLFYGRPPYNGVQPQNLDLAAPSTHYNPYLAPPSGIRDFPVQLNHAPHDHLSLSTSNTHRNVGIPSENYFRDLSYMDGVRGAFKRKNADVAPLSYYHYQNASAGSSSSVVPMPESDIPRIDAATFVTSGDPTSVVEGGSLRSMRNGPGMIAPESVLAHNTSPMAQGNYVSQPAHLPGNPWLDMNFGANNGDVGSFAWTQSHNLPYVHAGVIGPCVETGNIGVQGYQVAAINRSAAGFLPPHIVQGRPNPHHPPPLMQGAMGYNVNHPPQVAAAARSIHPFQDVDGGPTFLAPVPPTGFRLYRPHQREIILDPNARHRNLPHLRVLPEDEVAVLEIPGYHEAGDSNDQHMDMRLDIDHMSYEELLALGEQIGSVGTGLSEDFIRNNLKTRRFSSSPACVNRHVSTCADQQTINFCVVCQTDYEHDENIGTLDCGHEYHQDCIKKWLLVKNSCPVCKSTALSGKGKNMCK